MEECHRGAELLGIEFAEDLRGAFVSDLDEDLCARAKPPIDSCQIARER
jgi:hypothetical protein